MLKVLGIVPDSIRHNDGGDMGWTELAQGRDGWRVPVSTVMNLRVP